MWRGLVSIADNRSRRGRPETEWTRPAQISLQVACFCPRITSSSNRSPSNFDRMKRQECHEPGCTPADGGRLGIQSRYPADFLRRGGIYVWRSRETEAET